MQRHDTHFIGGAWLPARGQSRLGVVNPFTEEEWGAVPDADDADIDAAVNAAREALTGWAATSPSERADGLRRLADQIDLRAGEFTRLITAENGTPVSESRHAAPHAAAHLRLVADLAAELERDDLRPNPLAPGYSRVEHRPVGVAALITPWNFPLSLIIIKLGPALLAGCATVIKPAAETPMAPRLLMEAVRAAGLPAGTVNLVTGGAAAGRALVEHPGIATVSFTGSTAAGRSIGETCGRLLRPATLELGGKSPAIVLSDADPEVVASNILKVSMRNTGQTCKACTRLLVPAERHDEYLDLVVDAIGSAAVGDPTDPETFFGPLVSDRQLQRVLGYLESGLAQGAKPALGGGRPRGFERGYFVEPTVFRDVEPTMRIAREEIFGPVLVVLPYRDLDEAVALANDSDYGLAATVFSSDVEQAEQVAARLETGNVGINHYGSNAAAPFGGHKDSGLGTEFGPEGLAEYLLFTSIHYPS